MISAISDRSGCRIDVAAGSTVRSGLRGMRLLVSSSAIRIDNHAHIAQMCQLPADASLEQLLAAGWRRWGTSLSGHLRGAFAFVIFDSEGDVIYAARDHLGVAPLFVAHCNGATYFGQTSQIVRAMVQRDLPDDTLMLADFVADACLERDRTFFEGISRVPAAHWMLIDRAGTRTERYWSLSDVPSGRQPDRPVERFRALFDQSVRSCLSAGQSTLLLSGGLDSSALAASAVSIGHRSDLHALSLTYRETAAWCDGPHLAAVADKTGIVPAEVAADRHDPLADMDFWLRAVDGPHVPRGQSSAFQLLLKARAAGSQVVLSGHGGDEIVSFGFGRLNELAKAGRWLCLWRETAASAGLYGDNRMLHFARYLSHKPRFQPILRRLSRYTAKPHSIDGGFLSDEAAAQVPADRYERRTVASRLIHDERMLHEETLNSAIIPTALEVLALSSQAAGVDTRLPFYNLDLLEFSLSLPSDWKLRDGMSRYILRSAFEGDLPPKTLARQDKFDFAPAFIAGLCEHREKVLDLTDPVFADRWNLVNRKRLDSARSRLHHLDVTIENTDAFFLWRVAVLGMWASISREPPQGGELRPIH